MRSSTTSKKQKSPRAAWQKPARQRFRDLETNEAWVESTWADWTNRELFLRHELCTFEGYLNDYFEMSPGQRKRYAPCFTPAWLQAHLKAVLDRAFGDWSYLCNDNCKGLYFCVKKWGHDGDHAGMQVGPNDFRLVWEKTPAQKRRERAQNKKTKKKKKKKKKTKKKR